MNNKLLLKAFEKAKKEVNSESVTPRAKVLSDYITEDSKEPYGERILREKYNRLNKTPESTIVLKKHVEHSLSHYLGYDDYPDFVKNNLEENHITKNFFDRKKIIVTIILLIIVTVAVLIYNYMNRQRYMVWNEDHYIEVNLDVNKYNLNQLKLYKEERISDFKKVKPNCDYEFFNKDGTVNIWYGKNKQKELEFFTALGLHPETGKTLKPITSYMINKYLCKGTK